MVVDGEAKTVASSCFAWDYLERFRVANDLITEGENANVPPGGNSRAHSGGRCKNSATE